MRCKGVFCDISWRAAKAQGVALSGAARSSADHLKYGARNEVAIEGMAGSADGGQNPGQRYPSAEAARELARLLSAARVGVCPDAG
jgi:hypothetical protein